MSDAELEDRVRDAVQRLLCAAAPERTGDVAQLLSDYGLIFHRASDRQGFTLQAGAFQIVQFTQRSLDQMWILGHAAWRSVEAYSAYLAICGGRITRRDIDALDGQAAAEDEFNRVVDAAERSGAAEQDQDLEWPVGIPRPSPEASRNVHDQATFDITMIASAFTFLHEAKHVAFAVDGNAPSDPRDEELACDRFASEFLLSEVARFSSTTQQDAAAVAAKRTVGIALGLFFVVAMTPERNRSGTPTHPALGQRLRPLIETVADGPAWSSAVLCSLLLAWTRRLGTMPEEIAFGDYGELFGRLLECLEK